MADYHGTNGADVIDQTALGLANGVNVFGEGGDDVITLKNGNAIGGPGNDTLKALTTAAGVAYWTSTAGVVVDLAKGTAQDGLGGVDTLSGFTTVQDSNYSDTITGSSADETFWLTGGSDTVAAGAGFDTVVFWDRVSTNTTITYDASADSFTIKKRFAGDTGTTVLTGVERILFVGSASDQVTINTSNYLPNGRYVLGSTLSALTTGAQNMQQLLVGDFTGDGKADIATPTIDFASNYTVRGPVWLFSGDGQGHFADVSASNMPSTAGGYYVARSLVGDFNEDGRADIFALDSGPDREPFPGGQNSVILSKAGGGFTASTSAVPQFTLFTHGGAVGDVNGDGHLDVAVFALNAYSQSTPKSGSALQILLGDGKGGFTLNTAALPAYYKGTSYNPGNTAGALIDVNNDGRPDLIVGRWTESVRPSEVYLNDGQGFSTIAPVALPSAGVSHEAIMAITPIDLNGDGRTDLAVSVTNGGTGNDFYTVAYVQLLINDGGGKFHDETQARLPQSPATPTTSTGLHWYKTLQAVDVNGDGFLDLVAGADTAGRGQGSSIFVNDGSGKFTKLSVVLPTQAVALTNASGGAYAFAANEEGVFKVIANDLPSTASVLTAFNNILRETTPTASHLELRGRLITGVGTGAIESSAATTELIKAAATATSVATLSYQFFTGKIPSQLGIDYLVSPTGGNGANLNSAYYQNFGLENRYINFAVNLGKVGEGNAKFTADYGSLTLFEATKKAYATIFGVAPSDEKVHLLLDPSFNLNGQTMTRSDYFAYYGGDGTNGIGTKAAMVGWLLSEAVKADVGMYAKANDAFLADLADGATFAIDLVGVYGKPEYTHF